MNQYPTIFHFLVQTAGIEHGLDASMERVRHMAKKKPETDPAPASAPDMSEELANEIEKAAIPADPAHHVLFNAPVVVVKQIDLEQNQRTIIVKSEAHGNGLVGNARFSIPVDDKGNTPEIGKKIALVCVGLPDTSEPFLKYNETDDAAVEVYATAKRLNTGQHCDALMAGAAAFVAKLKANCEAQVIKAREDVAGNRDREARMAAAREKVAANIDGLKAAVQDKAKEDAADDDDGGDDDS